MFIASVLLCSFLGLMLNMSFAGALVQPDWSLAILLATLLCEKRHWPWVLPSVLLHDLVLFWSVSVALPYVVLAALLMYEVDNRLGLGQPQRWAALCVASLPLWWSGIAVLSAMMTMMLSVGLWFWLSKQRDGNYVEST